MDYARHYILLMRKAQGREAPAVRERHHVFPVSIYGKNDITVNLTPREHYVAHVLLYRAFKHRYGRKDKKTIKMLAAVILLGNANFNEGKRRISSRVYEQISKENRALQSELMKGKNNRNYGKKHSPESRKKISEGLAGRKHSPEARKRMADGKRGKHWFHNGEISIKSEICPEGFTSGRPSSLGRKISRSKKGMKISESHKERLRILMTGEGNHQYGKRGQDSPAFGREVTEATRRKISEANKGRTMSQEHKKRLGEGRMGEKSHCWGKHWYNDGTTEVLAVECPEGFNVGRLRRA
jgi:hypothetical protein